MSGMERKRLDNSGANGMTFASESADVTEAASGTDTADHAVRITEAAAGTRSSGTILWLTGWSMPDAVFDGLRAQLPEFRHVSADYGVCSSPEEMMELVEQAARSARQDPPSEAEAFRLAEPLDASQPPVTFPPAASNAARHRSNRMPLESPLLVAGWSLGGLLALRLAGQGLADGLVLLAATARFVRAKEESDKGWPDGYIRTMIPALAEDRQAVETRFRRTLFTAAERKSGLDAALPAAGSWTAAALTGGLQLLRQENRLSGLPETSCPVLLVHGTDDQVCPYGAALEMLELLPKAHLIGVPGCGHVPFLGREAKTAEEIRRWWDGQR